jgi:hypothetical protein
VPERTGRSRPAVTERFRHPARGYQHDMEILILILVVLAIIALALYILRRSRVR